MRPLSTKARFIKKKLLFLLLYFILPVLVLGILLVSNSYRQNTGEMDAVISNSLTLAEDSLNLLAQDSQAVNYYFESGNQFSSFISLMNSPAIDYSGQVAIRYFVPFLNSIRNTREYLDSIYIYFPNEHQRVYTSSHRLTLMQVLEDSGWEAAFDDMAHSQLWATTREMRTWSFEKAYPVISVYQKFATYNGGIVSNYRKDYFEAQLEAMCFHPSQLLMLFDSEGNLLVGSAEKAMAEAAVIYQNAVEMESTRMELDGQGMALWTQAFAPFGGVIVTCIPEAVLYASTWESLTTALLFLLLSVVITLAAAWYMAAKEYRQLRSIVDLFVRVQDEEPLPDEKLDRGDLYNYILHGAVRSFVENDYYQTQLSERKYKLKAAEMLALQTQINPHFLFNTLQSLNYKILGLTGGKPTEASMMLENLSDILRFSMQSPDSLVSIATEVDNCKKYLDIQQMRYDHQFEVRWEVDKEVLHYQVLRLVLQPLVENSIQHGLRNKPGRGKLNIRISLQDGGIEFRVIDNGVGIPKPRLLALCAELDRAARQSDISLKHIGLFNCNQRLALRYSIHSAIQIHSQEHRGTVVFFTIPTQCIDGPQKPAEGGHKP